MAESAQDLIGVFLGLVALWFLFGGLIKEERLWDGRHRTRGSYSLEGRAHGSRMTGR